MEMFNERGSKLDGVARTLSDLNDRLALVEESVDKTHQDLVEVSEKTDEDMKRLSDHLTGQNKDML